MATATKAAGKKAPAKAAKAPAKKVAAPVKKAPAKAAAPVKKAAPAKATTSKAETDAKREQRAKENAALGALVAKRREKGDTWESIVADTGQSQGKLSLLLMRHEQGDAESATPAKVKRDRDTGEMSWPAIAAKYGITKAKVQSLYRDAGGDPHASYIGKGGRYFGHEDKVADQRTVTKATPAKKSAAKKAAASTAKSMFAEDVAKEEVVKRIEGKAIVHRMQEKFGGGLSEPIHVKAGSVKVGAQKDGTRVVQFNDGDKTRTVAIATIVKVSR